MKKIDWQALVILAVFFVLIFIFWNSVFVYPVKLFVVLMHEVSHGLVAAATGGEIESIHLDYRLGGLCKYRGGIRFFVASAGYLGSLILGGIILVISSRFEKGYLISIPLGMAVILTMVLYIPLGDGWSFSFLFAAALIAMPFFVPAMVVRLTMMFIGLTSTLYAVIDIKEDLLTLEHRGSDSDALAELTMIPAIFWGLLWAALSVIGLALFVYLSIPKPNQSEAIDRLKPDIP